MPVTSISRLLLLTGLLVSAGCASDPKLSSVYPAACDITALHPADYQADQWCVLDAAAKRCSTHSDHCLVTCELAHGAQNVGGGCEHACYGAANTPENVAKNGGEFSPPAAMACLRANAAKRRAEGTP